MKTIHQWLDDYGTSHRNPTNKLIHWICVPAIFFSIVGFLYAVPVPGVSFMYLTLAHIALLAVILYYLRLSASLAAGMLLIGIICLWLWRMIAATGLVTWQVALVIFVLAWIGQFIGHKIEGAKPSFFKDLQFLLIGPAWLLSFIYKRVGIPL
ncbi:putative membrane protein YGL010W [Chitinophaga polysaccharea]|uniref:Putative membrane protein YGL010W n=1 Tax=Chitinophaga polysaccharea TaxID=1293035 RepID=A0A561PNQ6_9BACT|nr:Mpo1-like protein [Chitinophaga polysaccharea]TWF39746.1 putative membrane protein YGL010W [Chitinophaga polysaccharea]